MRKVVKVWREEEGGKYRQARLPYIVRRSIFLCMKRLRPKHAFHHQGMHPKIQRSYSSGRTVLEAQKGPKNRRMDVSQSVGGQKQNASQFGEV